MMNNALFGVLGALRSGGNPNAILQQMANQNPQIAQTISMLRGKDPAQLQSMAENMAKERGMSLNDLLRQFGLSKPSNR